MDKLYLLLLTSLLFAVSNTKGQNVGIGSNSPGSKLEIQGDAGTDLLDVQNESGTSRFYIENAGDVGIGTTSPNARLHINGSTSTSSPDVIIDNAVAVIQLGSGSVGPHGITFGDDGVQGLQLVYRTSPNQLLVEKTNDLTDGTDLFSIDYDNEYVYFRGNVGIGAVSPAQKLEVVGNVRISSLAGSGNRMVIANANGDLSSQSIPTGDITGVTAGDGLTGGGTSGSVTLNVVATNGLTDAANDIRLGGTLVQNTTVTQGTYGMTFNLNSTGDFNIQDNGTTHFHVADNGLSYFGDDVYFRIGSTGGTNMARIYDSANDGILQLYEDGGVNITLHGNGTTVFNEQSLNNDFRIESDGNANMVFVDASANEVGIGTGAPRSPLHVEGDIFFNNNALITAGGTPANSGTNVDHIWHDDGTPRVGYGGTWNFVSDASYKQAGNSLVRAGGFDGWGIVPLGSIIGWHKNLSGVGSLPDGWVECNGGTISDGNSPMNGQAIPNLNGATTSISGDASRGRFLRGHTSSGSFQNDQSNNFTQIFTDDTNDGCRNCTRTLPENGSWMSWLDNCNCDDRTRMRLQGRETRVTNMTVVWVMRIK